MTQFTEEDFKTLRALKVFKDCLEEAQRRNQEEDELQAKLSQKQVLMQPSTQEKQLGKVATHLIPRLKEVSESWTEYCLMLLNKMQIKPNRTTLSENCLACVAAFQYFMFTQIVIEKTYIRNHSQRDEFFDLIANMLFHEAGILVEPFNGNLKYFHEAPDASKLIFRLSMEIAKDLMGKEAVVGEAIALSSIVKILVCMTKMVTAESFGDFKTVKKFGDTYNLFENDNLKKSDNRTRDIDDSHAKFKEMQYKLYKTARNFFPLWLVVLILILANSYFQRAWINYINIILIVILLIFSSIPNTKNTLFVRFALIKYPAFIGIVSTVYALIALVLGLPFQIISVITAILCAIFSAWAGKELESTKSKKP